MKTETHSRIIIEEERGTIQAIEHGDNSQLLVVDRRRLFILRLVSLEFHQKIARSASMKHSGLQKEVFALYRTILREALKKDISSSGSSTSTKTATLLDSWKNPQTSVFFARQEFRKQAALVKRSDFRTIEHKIRHGQKQVKLLKMPGVKLVGGA